MPINTTRKCISLSDEIEFESSQDDPDEDCINCILDDILNTPEGAARDFWISLYRKGLIKLNCAKTGKSYRINKGFFERLPF